MKRVLGLCAAAVLLLAACGDDNDEAAADAGEAAAIGETAEQPSLPTPIRVLYSPNSEQLALFVAYDAGLFEERGLDVTLEEGTQIEVALVGGSADMGLSTAPDVLQAAQENLPLVFGAGGSINTPDNPRVFLVAGAESGVTTVSDLEGARVAVPGRGSFAELAIAILMEDEGLDPDTVNWVEVPFPQMADALEQGTVGAVVTVVPFVNFLEQAGHLPLIDASDLAPEVPIAVLAARRDWAEDNADAIVEFRAALDAAAGLIEAEPDLAKEIEQKYTGLPKEIVDQIPFTTFASEMTPAQVQIWIDILEQRGLIEPGLQAASLIVPPPSS